MAHLKYFNLLIFQVQILLGIVFQLFFANFVKHNNLGQFLLF
jgi:hypothetical protein